MSSAKPTRSNKMESESTEPDTEKKKTTKRKAPAKQTKASKKTKGDGKTKGKKGKKKKIKMLQRKQKQHLFSSPRIFGPFLRNKVLN